MSMTKQIPHVVKSKFSPQGGHGLSFEGTITLTHQSCRDECDINVIMAKYRNTGLITHVARHAGRYDNFIDATDYQTSIHNVLEAQDMFMELPSSIRKEFDNDPASFLSFVANPANRDRMISMGLIDKNLIIESDQKKSTPSVASPSEGEAE
jgi:phage internal scaffolding protein